MMEKQYNKMNKILDKFNNQYTDYISFLDSVKLDQHNDFQDKQNLIIEKLLAQEIESKRIIVKNKFYKNEINFLQDIPIVDKNDFKRDYIEVGWDRYSNVSEMIWYNKENIVKHKEYIYNKYNDLVKTIETQEGNLINLTIYKIESRGENFLDYSFDMDLNFAESNIEQKFGHIDRLFKFNDDSFVEIKWDDNSNASEIAWFNNDGLELKRNRYDKNNNLIQTIEGDKIIDNIDLSLAQIKFGDEEYIQKYKNQIYLNRKSIFDRMYANTLSGQVAGVLDVNYDLNGNKLNAVWFLGNREEKIKEIIFPTNVTIEQ